MQAQLTFGRFTQFIRNHKTASMGAALFLAGTILTSIGATLYNENNNAATPLAVIGAFCLIAGLSLMVWGRNGNRAIGVDNRSLIAPPTTDSENAFPFL
ncbi:MAG: hypothetical protein K0R66_786 [Gammaproteobacteria bacterium]|jgi:hypothetical protein|nr:hypothetical protein [Gammaproteobacteria bacterium]